MVVTKITKDSRGYNGGRMQLGYGRGRAIFALDLSSLSLSLSSIPLVLSSIAIQDVHRSRRRLWDFAGGNRMRWRAACLFSWPTPCWIFPAPRFRPASARNFPLTCLRDTGYTRSCLKLFALSTFSRCSPHSPFAFRNGFARETSSRWMRVARSRFSGSFTLVYLCAGFHEV